MRSPLPWREEHLRQVLNESPDAHAVVETLRTMARETGPGREDDKYQDSGEIFQGLLDDPLVCGGKR